ncbi:MAG: N-methyl-L-tryptophan oxidase [Planctomycetales bacterium]
MATYDAIVLGVGGIGSSALAHLASRGLHVLGIDRFPTAHDRGSSHGETRLIRQAYYEHPDYVPLLKRAYALWSDLEHQSGRKLYFESGVLQVGLESGSVIPGILASALQHKLLVEEISPAEVERRFPGYRVPEPLRAVFEPQAGFLRVEDCIRAYVVAAVEKKADLLINESVKSWRPVGKNIEVVTDHGKHEAGALIITAGSWAGELLSDLGLPLEVLRKSVYWYETDTPNYRLDRGQPGFIYETPEGNFYGFPEIDSFGVKIGEHTRGLPVSDPLNVGREEDAEETARIQAFLKRHLPQVSARKKRFMTCLYTLSSDRRFIVDRHPEYANVSYVAGLSGHGYKFASVLGEILADWTTTGRTSLSVEFLSAKRPGLRPATS